ncbi:MAG: FtsQ-type POTRA domain-containing protein [Kiritimatiellaeota bacterium]|nr:FtsQ-type POTRA domain-containing protein [Kiritimatiellota bacterium]
MSRDPILAVSARTPAQSKARVRRVSAIAVLLVALAGCVAAAYFGGQWVSDQLFAYNPLFTVHNLDIRTDGAVSSARIRERYNLRPGMNLFAVNLRTLHADLMKIPEVRAVDIQRQLPGTLRLRIGERVALARLAEDRPGARLAVDREGRVLGQSSWLAALPLITGWPKAGLQPGRRITERQMVDALTVLDLCVAPHRNVIRIQSLDVSNAEYVELHMAARVKRVWLGRSRLEARLDRLADILQELAKLGRTLEFLDLTMDRNIPGLVAPPAGMETL